MHRFLDALRYNQGTDRSILQSLTDFFFQIKFIPLNHVCVSTTQFKKTWRDRRRRKGIEEAFSVANQGTDRSIWPPIGFYFGEFHSSRSRMQYELIDGNFAGLLFFFSTFGSSDAKKRGGDLAKEEVVRDPSNHRGLFFYFIFNLELRTGTGDWRIGNKSWTPAASLLQLASARFNSSRSYQRGKRSRSFLPANVRCFDRARTPGRR
jgi:hypothetical protein